MLVQDWMSRNVITVNGDDAMQDATQLMKTHGIKMLPVLENGRLAGILTDRDLKRASASDASSLEIHELVYLLSKIKVRDVMTKKPVTVNADTTVEETARVLMAHGISGVPVLAKDGTIAGIITQTDLFKVIAGLTGQPDTGIQLALQTPDEPGVIARALETVRRYNGRIMSVLSTRAAAPDGQLRIYIRTYDIDQSQLVPLKTALAEKATLLYVVDHKAGTREIFQNP